MIAYHNSVALRNDGIDQTTGKIDLNAGKGVYVTVRVASSPSGKGDLAQIYDEEENQIANPLPTNNNGNYSFKANIGSYDIIIKEGTADQLIMAGVRLIDVKGMVLSFDTLQQALDYEGAESGIAVNIKERETGLGGGAVWDYVKIQPDDIGGATPPPIETNNVNIVPCFAVIELALKRRETQNIKPKISFVFDDAWSSTLGDLKTLFDARGYKFACAIPSGSLGNPNRLTLQDIPKLQENGLEVINHNHSGAPANSSTYGQAKIRAELQTCNSILNAVGVEPIGFQAPSSVMNEQYLDEVSRICPFAFTTSSKLTPITTGQDPLKLHRYSIEANSTEECVEAVNYTAKYGGSLICYAHDISTNDSNYDKITAIMDRAEELGIIDVVPVSIAVKSVTAVPQKTHKWFSGDLISNDPVGFSSSGNSTISVSNKTDIYITANSIQLTLVQATIDLLPETTAGEIMTFSSSLRRISGSFGNNNSIGIQLKNSSNTVLYSDEITGGALDTIYPRYNISAVQVTGATKATVYMRIDATTTGARALMRNPVFRMGTNVNPEIFTEEFSSPVVVTGFPAQTFQTAVTTNITLPTFPNNGLFKTDGSSIVFQRTARVNVLFSVVASGTNVGDLWKGGWVGISFNGSSALSLQAVAGGSNRLVGASSITLDIKRGDTLVHTMFADGEPFVLSVSNSRFTVIELK